MSVNEQGQGGPIIPGSSLARTLDGYAVPGLSAGFADRVLAAADARPAPLPPLRRKRSGWRTGQRLAIGIASFGALATAAAATGLLGRLVIPVPSAGTVWASITGTVEAAPARPEIAQTLKSDVAAAPVPVEIAGPIDTPEELGEAFRRIDDVRQGRREERRAIIDQRINGAIERRRAAGLPVPTAEQEARLRERIDQARIRRAQMADEQITARRAELQRKVESGEALTREDVTGQRPVDPDMRERVRELRQLTPEQRREVWRSLPPEQRRTMLDAARARRGVATAGPAPVPTVESEPAQQVAPAD